MSTSQERALRNHRRRLKERGLRRVEVEATDADASLIRELARLLRAGGERAATARRILTNAIVLNEPGLKELLASAPLEGIRITRSRDTGRTIDL